MTNLASPNKAFYLMLITFTLCFSLLLGLLTKMAPLAVSHTIYMCQKIISDFMITVPHSFPSILVSSVGLIASLGIFLFLLQLYKTQKFINHSCRRRISLPLKVAKIAKDLDILDKVEVTKSSSFFSFCYGFLNPKIRISSRVVKQLTPSQLKAVLIHESYHLKNKDPLKIFMSQIASSMFFFIPIIRDIKNYYILSKELAADQMVTDSNYGLYLRQALYKTLAQKVQFVGVASFASTSDLEQRIYFLAKKQKPLIHFSLFRLAVSLMVFLFAFVVVSLPVYAMEDNKNSNIYFICPFGGKCAMSCKQEDVIEEKPVSENSNFTPMSYSAKVTP